MLNKHFINIRFLFYYNFKNNTKKINILFIFLLINFIKFKHKKSQMGSCISDSKKPDGKEELQCQTNADRCSNNTIKDIFFTIFYKKKKPNSKKHN